MPNFGAGFRSAHFDEICAAPRAVDWFEVITDNFIDVGGPRRTVLERLRADYPIILHGLSLSIAGSEPLALDYVDGVRRLAEWIEPAWIGDHLCWTSLGGHQSHDLLPVAYNAAVLDHVCERVARVQDMLGRRLAFENPSAYVAFRADEMSEAEFFAELFRRTGCAMLLDVNNLFVNGANLGIDTHAYVDTLPTPMVAYMHLAGHAVLPDVRIDTHGTDVPTDVWNLYRAAATRFPEAGVIIERDDNLPTFAELTSEVAHARRLHAEVLAAHMSIATPPAQRATTSHSSSAGTTPPPWIALQTDFFARLVGKPVGFDHESDPALTAVIDAGRPVAAERGMRVYSDAYTASLRRALAVNFAALARVLDHDDFAQLAFEYLRAHPPSGHDLRALGRDLSAFIRSHRFMRNYGVSAEALADIAALEQAQLDVQDEADEQEALTPSALASLTPEDWERAALRVSRAIRFVHASHAVLPVLESVARGESPARPSATPMVYLVHRSGGESRVEVVDAVEALILEKLAAGRALGIACNEAAAELGTEPAPLTAASTVAKACTRGLLLSMQRGASRASAQSPAAFCNRAQA